MGSLTFAAVKVFFGRYWEVFAVLIAIGGGLWFVDHRGYERAKDQDRARVLERQALTAALVRSIDADLDRKLNAISAALGVKIDSIDTEGKTVVQPIIREELLRDPRLAAPGSCLSPSLLEAVNTARGYGRQSAARAGAAARPANAPSLSGPGTRH